MSAEVWAIIVAPLLALVLGFFLNKYSQDRPRLIAHISSLFTIRLPPPNPVAGLPVPAPGLPFPPPQIQMVVNTHQLFLRNTGGKPANNVIIGHSILPNFQVFPQIQYEVIQLPGGGKAIKIPTISPREQITVNYLYYPPINLMLIQTTVKSDEGLANFQKVLLQPVSPKWLQRLIGFLALAGTATVIYWLIRIGVFIVRVARR